MSVIGYDQRTIFEKYKKVKIPKFGEIKNKLLVLMRGQVYKDR